MEATSRRSQRLKSWLIATKKMLVSRISLTCVSLYLLIAVIALYQGCLLVDEYYTECNTLVELFSPTRIQHPAFSLCVPLEEVVSVSISHWKTHQHQNYTSAAHAYEAHIMDCKSRTGSNKKFCARSALTDNGILTMNEVFDGFLLTNSNLYLTTTLMDEQMTAYSLYTPMISLAGELCYTYFFKESPTLRRKFGSLDWELIDQEQAHFSMEALVIQYLLLSSGRLLSQFETDWSTVRPLQWEFHTPIVRGRQFAVEPLTPGYTWLSRFRYEMMDYSHCSSGDFDDHCITYAQMHRIDPKLENDSFNLSKAMSQNDCHAQKALEVSSSEWDCLAYGILTGGFTKWELPKDRKLHHCNFLHGHHQVSRISMFTYYERIQNRSLLGNQCPRDCINYVYAFVTKANQRLYWLDAIKKAFENAQEEQFDESVTSTVVISPEIVPFMQISRRHSMTGIQFVCNGCALLGMWFGMSVLSIVDDGRKLLSRLVTFAKEFYLTKTSTRSTSENLPGSHTAINLLQQIHHHVHLTPQVNLMTTYRNLTQPNGSFHVRY